MAKMTAKPIHSFSARSVLNASVLIFASSMILSLGGFAFHALASRKLGVEDYGALYSLISLYSVAVIPISLLAPVVTKYSAEFAALHDDSHVRGLIELIARAFGAFGLIYILVGIVLGTVLGRFLHVPQWQIMVVGIMAAVGIFSGAFRAMAQGVHDYLPFGLSLVAEGIGKVAILAAAAVIGLTVFRSISAFLLGMTLGTVFVVAPIIRRYRHVISAPIKLDWKRIMGTTAGAASMTVTMAFIGFADVIIVKHYFPAGDAGLYSAASLCARILLYFVGFVPAILIPQATHRHARGEKTRKTLLWSAVFVSIVSIGGVLAYHSFGWLILRALVGPAFDAAAPLLGTYAAAMAFLALTNTLGSYALATHRLAFVAPLLVATISTLAYIAVIHPTLWSVTQELLLGNIVMFAAVAIPLGMQSGSRVKA